MKTYKIIMLALVTGAFLLAGCTKEETETVTINKSVTDGQARIKGTVQYYDALTDGYLNAPGAIVQVAPDSVTKAYNQFWVTDTTGAFNVKGLAVGTYYINAVYTDKNGYQYSTNGFSVKVNNSVDDITLSLKCR